MRDVLLEGERLDDLQNGYCLIQDPQKFCFGMDAVLLSGFARVRPEEKVLDMCCGTGIIPILLREKTEGRSKKYIHIRRPGRKNEKCDGYKGTCQS